MLVLHGGMGGEVLNGKGWCKEMRDSAKFYMVILG